MSSILPSTHIGTADAIERMLHADAEWCRLADEFHSPNGETEEERAAEKALAREAFFKRQDELLTVVRAAVIEGRLALWVLRPGSISEMHAIPQAYLESRQLLDALKAGFAGKFQLTRGDLAFEQQPLCFDVSEWRECIVGQVADHGGAIASELATDLSRLIAPPPPMNLLQPSDVNLPPFEEDRPEKAGLAVPMANQASHTDRHAGALAVDTMTFYNLPEWLEGAQAIEWILTGNPKRALHGALGFNGQPLWNVGRWASARRLYGGAAVNDAIRRLQDGLRTGAVTMRAGGFVNPSRFQLVEQDPDRLLMRGWSGAIHEPHGHAIAINRDSLRAIRAPSEVQVALAEGAEATKTGGRPVAFYRDDLSSLRQAAPKPPVTVGATGASPTHVPSANDGRLDQREPSPVITLDDWFIRRVADWPADRPPPDRGQDRDAARKAGYDPPDLKGIISKLRKTYAEAWTKSGPNGRKRYSQLDQKPGDNPGE